MVFTGLTEKKKSTISLRIIWQLRQSACRCIYCPAVTEAGLMWLFISTALRNSNCYLVLVMIFWWYCASKGENMSKNVLPKVSFMAAGLKTKRMKSWTSVFPFFCLSVSFCQKLNLLTHLCQIIIPNHTVIVISNITVCLRVSNIILQFKHARNSLAPQHRKDNDKRLLHTRRHED